MAIRNRSCYDGAEIRRDRFFGSSSAGKGFIRPPPCAHDGPLKIDENFQPPHAGPVCSGPDNRQQQGEGFEYHLLVIGMSLALVLDGGGRWSVDRLIANTLAPRGWAGTHG
ncbi:MAG: DoxX family protein [Nitrospira sp.]|nr:DoxX family protein [Nitrospira sp.]